jgi:hypothetical protein
MSYLFSTMSHPLLSEHLAVLGKGALDFLDDYRVRIDLRVNMILKFELILDFELILGFDMISEFDLI